MRGFPFCDETGVEQVGGGERIPQVVDRIGMVQETWVPITPIFANQLRNRGFYGHKLVEVLLADRRRVCNVQPEHHLLGDSRPQHDSRRFGVEPEVKFRGRRRISRDVHIASHKDNSLDLRFNLRFHAQGQRDIRHWADRQHRHFPRIPLDYGNDELDGAIVFRLPQGESSAGGRFDLVRIVGEPVCRPVLTQGPAILRLMAGQTSPAIGPEILKKRIGHRWDLLLRT